MTQLSYHATPTQPPPCVPHDSSILYTTIYGAVVTLERVGGTSCVGTYRPGCFAASFVPASGIAWRNVESALTTGSEQGYPVTLSEMGQRVARRLLEMGTHSGANSSGFGETK